MMSLEEKALRRSYAEVTRDLEKDYRITQSVLRGEFFKKLVELKGKKKEVKDGED